MIWTLLLVAALTPNPSDTKTVIIGFDGMDYTLTRQFMDEGLLPNISALAERGGFQPLETTNPAQSPVSWAVFNTGANPGKTGVAGFVARKIPARHGGSGGPLPESMLGFPEKIPADDYVRFPMAMENRFAFVALAGVGALIAGLIVFKLVFRLGMAPALIVGVLAGGGAGWYAACYADALPADGKVPYMVNPMQGTYFWTYLDEQGIRMRGVQVASTYPPDAEGPNTEILAGLGVPDVGGSSGSFYVYTDDPWTLQDKSTGAGGTIKKVFEEGGRIETALEGPRNWVEKARFETTIDALEAMSGDANLSTTEQAELEDELAAVKNEYRQWRDRKQDKATVPFTIVPDRDAQTVTIEVVGRRETLEVGQWTDFIPVTFTLNDLFESRAMARFHLLRCDNEEVRVFVPPINIAPDGAPPWLPIASPPDFAADLAGLVGGPYETQGWACLSNPLKDTDDSKFEPQSYFDADAEAHARREAILHGSFDQADQWDVYYQVLGSTDRVAHMFFREFDETHPEHDAEYAATEIEVFGRRFPIKEAVREVYKETDRFVGEIVGRIDAGDLGDDVLLMIVSDHGFQSFKYQVNLNNVLHETGYLVFKDGQTLDDLMAGSSRGRDLLGYVDWTKTRAYSMGLGEVYVNLAGRELYKRGDESVDGIVDPADYDALIAEIKTKLLAYRDPDRGRPVITSVSRRDELYDGPWWKEGSAERKVRGEPVPVEHDGFADLFIGFEPEYRVAWWNTTGGIEKTAISTNTNHWSGDHVSVDPMHVQGILLSNRKLPEGTVAGLADIGPTMLERYGLDASTTEMDGRSLPFAGP